MGTEVLSLFVQAGADAVFILTGQRSAPSLTSQPQRLISPRQQALLDNYEATSDEGRRIIEATASAAAQPPSQARRRA